MKYLIPLLLFTLPVQAEYVCTDDVFKQRSTFYMQCTNSASTQGYSQETYEANCYNAANHVYCKPRSYGSSREVWL